MEAVASVGIALAALSPTCPDEKAAHVQRRQHDPLHEPPRLRRAEGEIVAQLLVHVGDLGQRGPLRVRGRPHVVVEAGDLDAAVGAAQAGDEMGEGDRGIGRPVAVVAAVQRTRSGP